MSTPRALRPLRNPAYRWLAAALVSSMIGTGIWMVALVWQIVAIGGGAAELSLVAGASAIGMLLTTLLGGALADRMSQKRILFVVEVVRAASVGIVAMLSLSGGLAAWQLAVVAFIGGVMAGLYYPAYSALLPSVLPEDQLLAANGFEGMARPMLMQAGGPALASALIAVSSPGAALAVTALTGVVAAACILKVPDMPLRGERPRRPRRRRHAASGRRPARRRARGLRVHGAHAVAARHAHVRVAADLPDHGAVRGARAVRDQGRRRRRPRASTR